MSLWTLNLIFKNSLLFKEIKYFNMIWALIGAIQLIYLNSGFTASFFLRLRKKIYWADKLKTARNGEVTTKCLDNFLTVNL